MSQSATIKKSTYMTAELQKYLYLKKPSIRDGFAPNLECGAYPCSPASVTSTRTHSYSTDLLKQNLSIQRTPFPRAPKYFSTCKRNATISQRQTKPYTMCMNSLSLSYQSATSMAPLVSPQSQPVSKPYAKETTNHGPL